MTKTVDARVRPVARTRAVLIVGAAAAAAAIWAITRGLGADLTANGRAVTLPAVIVTTVVVGLAASTLLSILERITRRATAVWTWVAVAVLALSLAGPAGAAETGGGMAALLAMHVAVAAVLIIGLRRTSRKRG